MTTRHYLNGIYLHATELNKSTFLTGVATDSHRLSSSNIAIENIKISPQSLYPEKQSFSYVHF